MSSNNKTIASYCAVISSSWVNGSLSVTHDPRDPFPSVSLCFVFNFEQLKIYCCVYSGAMIWIKDTTYKELSLPFPEDGVNRDSST